MSGIPDAAARARALDPGTSFIVQAPAGSGKTELLIQRYLVLLGRVERPEEIAAITFTRKAAAEMRRRIFQALACARGDEPKGEHQKVTYRAACAVLKRDAALGWNLEQNAVRLRVQTIDALCASLTRQMPVLSGFGAQPRSVDDATAHYAEAARNLLAALEDESDPAATDLARLLGHLDNDAARLETLLADLLAHRDQWLRPSTHGATRADLEASIDALRLAAVERVRALIPAGSGIPVLPPIEDVDAWRALANGWLTGANGWRKRPTTAPVAFAEVVGLLEAMCALKALPDAGYSDAQWEILAAILRLLPRAASELALVFAQRGECDFAEITLRALAALDEGEGPSDLMLALDYRIRHILVDEFQDTSITQKELLERLTSGWEPGDGRTLFVVGDPMQSIYRFREAEVGLFLAAQRDGLGSVALEPLVLRANFRSQAGIVDWVNDAFARVMPSRDHSLAGAVHYSDSIAVHPAAGAAVRVHRFFDRDDIGEAREVARLAKAAIGAPTDGGEKPRTVAILVRNRKHLEHIIPQLRAQKLRFRAIDLEPLLHRPVVQDLLALTRALSHPADRVACLAVLRAPWCGLTLQDLEILAGADRATLWERIGDREVAARLSPDGRARVERVEAVLARSLAQRSRGRLRDAVEAAWLALQGPACLADDTAFEDAEAYLSHLDKLESAGRIPSLALFEASLAKLYARPDRAAPESLQLMTIHNAKGLEFDVVIVPGLHRGSGKDDNKLLVWMETLQGLLMAPMNPTGSTKEPLYALIRALDNTKAEHENGRVLYVAATRARRELHLMGDCERDPSGAAKAPPGASLLCKLWPAVSREFTAPEDPPDAFAAASSGGTPPPSREDELWRLAERAPVAIPAAVAWKSPLEPERDRDAIEFSWVGETARHVGSVVHRWLQRIADDELRGWDRARIAAAHPAIVNGLAARGLAAGELESAAARVADALAVAISDPRGRWLLGPQREARNEYRISALVGGERRRLVIDRSFVDVEGRSWVVDYKTSSHQGADPEGFLAAEQNRYREQLERYAAVTVRGPAMLGLYFPVLRGWREWPAPRANEVDAALTE